MSRKSLSRASGVSERYLAELERGAGNASLLVLRQIAEALSIEASSLVSDAPERPVDLTLALHQLERATGCVGIFLEDRPYPNLLAVSIDLASLESIGTVHGSGPGTDLKDDHAYRVPGVSPERALIVVLAGNSDGPAIAWRAPFPVEACSLLAKPLRDGTPSVCR